MLKVINIVGGALAANCYLITTPDLQALIVDPGAEPGTILNVVRAQCLAIKAYLITHGHMDHISALDPLWARMPAPVFMHGADVKWAFGAANQMPPYYAIPRRPALIEHILQGDESLQIGGFHCQAMAAPGHSPGGVCFYFPEENILFSGDTLFQDSVGRTDLPGGDQQQLNKSLRALAALPAKTTIYPGHGPTTTIDRELKSNPFLQEI